MCTKAWGAAAIASGIPGVSRRAEATGTDCLNAPPPNPRHPYLRGPSIPAKRAPREADQPPSAPLPSCTFLHGLDDTSNEALNALLCWVVRMVLGRLGRLWSLPSSAAPLPAPWADLQRLSSSSLLPGRSRRQGVGPSQPLLGAVLFHKARGPCSQHGFISSAATCVVLA